MPRAHVVRETRVVRSPRVMKVEGMFDVPPSQKARLEWNVDLRLPDDWSVGAIVGPSGCGKSTIARELFGDAMVDGWSWDPERSILDGFPTGMGIAEITDLLTAVGFSTPPAWVRPHQVLSNGERFRVDMARALAERPELVVMDEFTSVVDRQVAKIGSHAVQKAVRSRGGKFVAVACHYDILEWLRPDWVYEPHTGETRAGRSVQRPSLDFEVRRVNPATWAVFRTHHYLSDNLHQAARCFGAFAEGRPVAFCAVLHFPHPKAKNIKRGHRTVVLPDYQGLGLGPALSEFVGSVVRGLGYRYLSQTSHPRMIRARKASTKWRTVRDPQVSVAAGEKSSLGANAKAFGTGGVGNRLVASFEYVGPALPREEARAIWDGA